MWIKPSASAMRLRPSIASHLGQMLMFVKARSVQCADRHLDTGLMKPSTGIGHAMTLRDRERQQINPRAQTFPPVQRTPGAFLTRLSALDTQATSLKLRQRQRVVLTPAQDDLIFALQSGVVSTRIAMATGDAGLITLYFPGDVIAVGAVPNFTERALVAATPADALRYKSKSMLRLLTTDPDLLAAYDRQRDRQAVRAGVHAAILATLDGPQRLAAFLIEMALELGVATGSTIAIDLPLSRTEIAQHLALNADTLSRLMSRFKADGLITQKSRHHIALRNWRALADMCPVSPALMAIERNRPSPLN
jgi:CRP-like cAMP-binding protein